MSKLTKAEKQARKREAQSIADRRSAWVPYCERFDRVVAALGEDESIRLFYALRAGCLNVAEAAAEMELSIKKFRGLQLSKIVEDVRDSEKFIEFWQGEWKRNGTQKAQQD